VKLGAGEDLCALFAGILTMRPWNRVVDPAIDHLVIQGSDSERSELQVIVSSNATDCACRDLFILHIISTFPLLLILSMIILSGSNMTLFNFL